MHPRYAAEETLEVYPGDNTVEHTYTSPPRQDLFSTWFTAAIHTALNTETEPLIFQPLENGDRIKPRYVATDRIENGDQFLEYTVAAHKEEDALIVDSYELRSDPATDLETVHDTLTPAEP